MAYLREIPSKRISFLSRLTVKLGKFLARFFPLNAVRVWGLRLCGFKIGKNVYIGSDLIIASILGCKDCILEIGDRVAIGPRVTIVLSSDANWSRLSDVVTPIRGKVTIKNDTWIGAGAIILPNITIQEMSIIGAGSVVTKDVPSYTVVAGIPAKIIKKIEL